MRRGWSGYIHRVNLWRLDQRFWTLKRKRHAVTTCVALCFRRVARGNSDKIVFHSLTIGRSTFMCRHCTAAHHTPSHFADVARLAPTNSVTLIWRMNQAGRLLFLNALSAIATCQKFTNLQFVPVHRRCSINKQRMLGSGPIKVLA
jgi:hypothetical protein